LSSALHVGAVASVRQRYADPPVASVAFSFLVLCCRPPPCANASSCADPAAARPYSGGWNARSSDGTGWSMSPTRREAVGRGSRARLSGSAVAAQAARRGPFVTIPWAGSCCAATWRTTPVPTSAVRHAAPPTPAVNSPTPAATGSTHRQRPGRTGARHQGPARRVAPARGRRTRHHRGDRSLNPLSPRGCGGERGKSRSRVAGSPA